MNRIIAVAVFAAAFVLLISGCQNADAPKVSKTPVPTATAAPKVDEHGHTDDAPRISIAEAKKEFDAGTAVFVDTRAEVAWRAERIKGAISVPAEAVLQRYKDIPTDKKIIAYCTWPDEHSSASLVSELKKKGIGNGYALVGGMISWKNAGYPMETEKK